MCFYISGKDNWTGNINSWHASIFSCSCPFRVKRNSTLRHKIRNSCCQGIFISLHSPLIIDVFIKIQCVMPFKLLLTVWYLQAFQCLQTCIIQIYNIFKGVSLIPFWFYYRFLWAHQTMDIHQNMLFDCVWIKGKSRPASCVCKNLRSSSITALALYAMRNHHTAAYRAPLARQWLKNST